MEGRKMEEGSKTMTGSLGIALIRRRLCKEDGKLADLRDGRSKQLESLRSKRTIMTDHVKCAVFRSKTTHRNGPEIVEIIER